MRFFRPVVTISGGAGGTTTPASAADTNASRSWIKAPTVWQVPTTSSQDNEGEGIVVADVDTGINSENSSFAATGPKDVYIASDPGNLRFGVCDSSNRSQYSQRPSFFKCNDKLIGAYTYTKSTGNDLNSPEDSDGHGSHTASTVVGNFVDTTFNGTSTPLSGVAPHASLIAYDVCDPVDQCGTDASVKAVDQAIQDQAALRKAWGSQFKGMVLNYSIGGSDDAYGDPVEQAFLSAVETGIYISAAGGNGGPANAISNDPVNAPLYPVQHTGPWVATVAAATHYGISGNTLSGFAGGDATTLATLPSSMSGASGSANPVALTNIVYVGDGTYNNDDPAISGTAPTSNLPYPASTGSSLTDAAECLYPFTGVNFAGAIVVCDRGTNPLVDKAYNVEQGGAAGVVILTTGTSSQDFVVETYVIPGTLMHQSDGDKLRNWLNASAGSGTAKAQLSGAVLNTDASQADQVAGFSSRGPTDTVYDNLVKPDLTAPGVSVLAAFSNPKYTDGCTGCASQPEDYGFLDGTSMATPHDSGAAALLKQAHPAWTPAEIKSALMLTAVTAPNGTSPGLTDQCASLNSGLNCVAGTTLPSPQVRGAGRIDVDAADRAGLILDENGTDYAAANPNNGGDLTTLNLASLANNGCAQNCTWTRTVTSAFVSASVTYSVSVSDASTGLAVNLSPQSFSLAPGATQKLTITAFDTNVKQGSWAFAQVDITSSDTGDGGAAIPAMHLPLAVLSVPPTAHMSIMPAALGYTVSQGSSAAQQFTISNSGQSPLDWKLAANSDQQVLAGVPADSTGALLLSTGSIWNQPDSGSGNGFPSTYYTSSGHGLYVADSFDLPVKASISAIESQGFAQDKSGPVSVSGKIDWYIYADSAGVPKGNPEDHKNDYVWHYSANAGASGVGTTNGVITLDLGAAGQPDVALTGGSYWLITVPSFNSSIADSNDPSWYWLEGKSLNVTANGQAIDPSNALGGGTSWQALQTSFALTLSGTFDCTNHGITGLSFDKTSGSVARGASQTVTATFKAGG
ncbi:MAG TPA: S8 family serine peptidase, partial [Gammaproteobacteria bacterium]|nr:S8 family serine peptidase [Gammaproteobacteria bacterium]